MHIRPARRSDAADLAILDDMASSGLASWLWQGAVDAGKAGTAFERGRQKLGSDKGPVSWRNALVLEIDGDVAGMSLSYMAEPPQPPRGVADPVLAPLIELAALAAGTWYVDALAVYSAYRGRQAGRLLMKAEIARAEGRAMSLITEDDNERALALYASLGFREAARRDCVKFKPAQTTRAFVLLKRPATL